MPIEEKLQNLRHEYVSLLNTVMFIFIVLINCGLVRPYNDRDLDQHWLSNVYVPGGTKSLTEPMLAYHHWGLLTFTWGQFHNKHTSHRS